jgi:hypothetical protein
MLSKKTRPLTLLILITLCLLLTERSGRGTITSITLTPANPTTMSNALGYYLAGKAYVFTVNVVDPDVTAWNQITDVRITIANAPNIVVRNTAAFGVGAAPLAADTAFAVTIVSGTVDATGLVTAGSTYNNFTAQFTITFRWDTPASVWAAGRNITGSATTNNPSVNTLTDTRLLSYGVGSTIRIVGFAQSGDAADGRVTPWHPAFNVTGTIAYNIPGAVAADAVHLVADAGAGEIAVITLLHSGGSTIADDDNDETSLNIPVPAEWMNDTPGWVNARGNRTWSIQTTMNTPGGPETSANTLAINCDRIQITNIQFLGGGGVNPGVRYYRGVNLPGTQVRVTAQLEFAGTPMVGNTTIRIGEYTGADNPTGATSDVVIANGQTIGVAALTYPPGAATPAGDTTPLRYGAIRVFGGSYDGANAGAVGQYIDDFAPLTPSPIRITQPAYPAYIIYWDNEDPPGDNGAEFTPFDAAQPTATSLTFTWTALDPMTHDDHDFYSYRIYYRENGTLPWITIDRNTGGFAALANIATNTASIQGLVPLTTYDYFISAVDVFGNEVYILSPASVIHGAPGPNWGEVQTLALSILAEVTDGIANYLDASFTANQLPSARPVRVTAIRVRFHITGTADTLPETVNMIVAQEPGGGDLISGGIVDPGAMPWYRINCVKTGPNTWTGYIPDTNPLIAIGTDVRFVIEMIRGASTTYADHNSELEVPAGIPPVTPNDYEWNFNVITPTTFQPWPTRILNNVITDKDPVAYPAYYLSEDAYVTIKVFDIKGRPVTTLLDNAFRKGGQNIKEGGWRGDNKANRKLGVGLYYIQIEAKSVSSGKVILNSFQKVVMAR